MAMNYRITVKVKDLRVQLAYSFIQEEIELREEETKFVKKRPRAVTSDSQRYKQHLCPSETM